MDVEFLPSRQFNSTFANGIGEGTRDVNEFFDIIAQGDAAGVGSPDPLVVDYYFVSRVPGQETPSLIDAGGGRAFVGRSGATQAITEFSLDFGRSAVARVLAHEIAHNLGLRHTDDDDETNPTLLDPVDPSGFLTENQIQQILNSPITQPV